MVLLVVFFSVMAPIGILAGSVIRAILAEQGGKTLEAYCTAIAAGSFLYVAIVDILVEEFMITRDKWWKTAALLLGFCLEATVVLLFESIAHSKEEHAD